jgi:uncharacterized protein
MEELVGREHEVKILNDLLSSDRSELVAMYGRRRIGKTFLIKQVYKKHTSFELTGLHNANLTEQLENFSEVLKKNYPHNYVPKSWLSAFKLLEEYICSLSSKKKKVIFIDEFPWLAGVNSKFLTAFENFWNVFASIRKDLVIIICGSSASYMVQKIIKNKGGLHNRITQSIRLMPFNLYETELFLRSRKINFSRYDILQLYMAIGGVPHYLDKIKPGESVAQVLDRLCFSKDGALTYEFDNVFASLFNNDDIHQNIVKSLAKIKKGVTRGRLLELLNMTSGGTVSSALEELIESGFVNRYYPYKSHIKQSLYRLSDEFSIFYLYFIKNRKANGAGTWLTFFSSRQYSAWLGYSFESVCLKHIHSLKKELGIAAIYSENSSWISDRTNDQGGAQIDLLIDRADNIINVCEMKFSNEPFVISKKYLAELKNKLSVFKREAKSRKALLLTLVSPYGVKQNAYSLEIVQNNLTMDCLFKV